MLRYGLWGLVALTIVAVGAVGLQTYLRGSSDDGLYESAVDTIGGPFSLVRSDTGEAVTDADFADRPKVMFFGFTYCPDVCPTTLFELATYLDQLGEDADNLHTLMITIDPERDTPEFLQQYVGAFSDRIVGLTGTQEAVDEAVANYRVYARRVELDDGDYTMDHTASIFLMDHNNELVGTIAYQEDPATALAKLQRLAELGS
ncbi:MAG: SCO family protein [Devosiaceae bacterium]|nr:SCO family protein [Devosiaceae bacterium MH13]